MKNEKDMIKCLNNLKNDIGQPQHSQLWHYAEILDVIARYLGNTERAGITTDMATFLHEGIRCEALCTNPMKSDRGCDGGCQYDTELLKRIDEVIKKVIVDSPTERTEEWIPCTKGGLPLTELGRKERQKWYGYKCSKCNFIYKGNALTESPFCQNCGTKMK